MATQIVNRYAIDHSVFDISKVQCVFLKHCELCGVLHITEDRSARFPGDLLPMQRAAGHRHPLICESCKRGERSLAFRQEQAAEMLQIADDLKKLQDIRAVREEERLRYRKPREIMHESKHTASQARARQKWAKWRIPLMEAFREKGELTSSQIASIMNKKYRFAALAVSEARHAGIPIVVLRTELRFDDVAGRSWRRKVYTLSSSENLEPLTPPQDPVTHQFMREVQA